MVWLFHTFGIVYLDEHGDGHHSHVWFTSCVIDEVQVNHFLDFQYWYIHNIDYIGKKWRHVVSHCHVSHNLLHHCLLLCVLWITFVGIELCSKLLDLAYNIL
jgi:hypothetical protein